MRLPGLRRALPERLEALLLFMGRRRGEAFFFAVLAMVVLSFSFPDDCSAQQRINNT
jgi:hypothetical protein